MVTATGPAPGSEMTTSAEPTEDRSTSGVLHVAAIFASHMVLQRNKPIAVFGALDADCAGLEVSAEIRDFDGVAYYNDGDWVEGCTALVEHMDGRMEVLHWPEEMARRAAKAAGQPAAQAMERAA